MDEGRVSPRRGRRPGQGNYTAEKKEAALILYREKGQAEAHRLTGIPVSSLARWAGEAGIRAPVTAQSVNLPNVRKVAAEVVAVVQEAQEEAEAAELSDIYDPEEVSRMWLTVARLSYDAYTAALINGADMAAQRLNNCLGTATDKLQLLNGRATSRGEKLANPDEATGALLSIFDAIRARQEGPILTAHSRPAVERVPGDYVAALSAAAEEGQCGPWALDAQEPRGAPGARAGDPGE